MPDIDRRSALTGAAALLGASLARPAHAATASIVTVSYTHLTLPTIYSV